MGLKDNFSIQLTGSSGAHSASVGKGTASVPTRAVDLDLAAVRVVQQNLIYITNLPSSVAKEDWLKKPECFGQYGTILKCIIVPNKTSEVCRAYLTYSSPLEASLAITATHRFPLLGSVLEVTLGTSRYCSYYLSSQPCPRSDCFFLHQRFVEGEVILKDKARLPSEGLDPKMYVKTSGPVLPRIWLKSDYQPSNRRESRFGFARDGLKLTSASRDPVKDLADLATPSQKQLKLSSALLKELMSSPEAAAWAPEVLFGCQTPSLVSHQ